MASWWSGCCSSTWRSDASSPASSSAASSLVGLAGQQPLDELAHRGLGLGADEPVDDLALVDRVDGGDALHPERLRHLRVVVDVDLGQHDLPAGLVDDLLEDGTERAARAAPRRPQVDDDGGGGRPVEHVGLERGVGDVDGHRARLPAARAGQRPVRAPPPPVDGRRAAVRRPVGHRAGVAHPLR